jgi:hypothetical protein
VLCGLASGIKVVFFHVKLESNYVCVPTFGTFQFYHKSINCDPLTLTIIRTIKKVTRKDEILARNVPIIRTRWGMPHLDLSVIPTYIVSNVGGACGWHWLSQICIEQSYSRFKDLL